MHCAAGGSIAGLSPGSSMELPAMRAEGGDSSAAGFTPNGDKLEGGDPGLMGWHTGPTAQGADYAQGAQDRARAGREAHILLCLPIRIKMLRRLVDLAMQHCPCFSETNNAVLVLSVQHIVQR